MHQSFIDNKIAPSRQNAIAKSLHSRLHKEQVMTDQTLQILLKDIPRYLHKPSSITKLNPSFPFLIQGASITHSKIISASPSAGRSQAIKVIASGGSDFYASLVYKKANKGHWVLTAREKLILSHLESGKSEAEAIQLANKKGSVNEHCENYTGKTITCDGKLFVLSKEQKVVSKKNAASRGIASTAE